MDIGQHIESEDIVVIEPRVTSIDASNVREFRDLLLALTQDRDKVVLDLSAVRFIDSSGLGALIGCQRQVQGRQGEFRLCALTATVRALFELMRLHRVFNIHATREDALVALA